jgi:hypothetical protein
MNKFFVVCSFAVLLLAPFLQAPALQDTLTVDLSDYSWNRTTLHALIVTADNQTWWNPYFVNLSVRAIEQWNQAFQFFAATYSGYAYMSSLRIRANVSNQTLPGYDIYISFCDTINSENTLGLTQILPYYNKTIEKCTVAIAVKTGYIDLTTSDQRDVTTHELGHALGLGHSNYSNDLMYPTYDLLKTDNAISTLDLFGVARCFRWCNPQDYHIKYSNPRTVTLPATVNYGYAPILNPSPKSIDDNPLIRSIQIIFDNPMFTIMAVTLVAFLIFSAFIYRSKNKPAMPPQSGSKQHKTADKP